MNAQMTETDCRTSGMDTQPQRAATTSARDISANKEANLPLDSDQPNHSSSPPPPSQDACPMYITVFEHAGAPIPGLARPFMRHSSIYVQSPPSPASPCPSASPSGSSNGIASDFSIYHITGTPGIGMTFAHLAHMPDPRDTEPTLLLFHRVGAIPTAQAMSLEGLLAGVEMKVSWSWNCQDWVRAALAVLVRDGLLGGGEMERAVQVQREVVEGTVYAIGGDTPNTRAVGD